MTPSFRPLDPDDAELLSRAVLDNITWNGANFLPHDLARPELAHYLRIDPSRGDFGIVAVIDDAPIGVVWLVRLPSTDPGYGFVDDSVPELSVWVHPDHRGDGVGRALVRRALTEAGRQGLTGVSLSVERGNPARELYVSEGFRDVAGAAPGVMLITLGGSITDSPERHGWQTTGSREVYANPWIRVREDTVVRPDGDEGIYGVMTMQNPAVFVVALDDDGAVLMVSLYRYATRGMSLEVPAGGCDGDEPLVAAKRELLEETGFEAREWQEIGRMNALNGVCDAPEYVYVATGLTRGGDSVGSGGTAGAGDAIGAEEHDAVAGAQRHDIDVAAEQAAEGIDAVRFVPWDEAMTAVREGRVSDGETVAALMFAALALGKL